MTEKVVVLDHIQQAKISRIISSAYLTMFLGLSATGIVSAALASSPELLESLLEVPGLFIGLILAELAFVLLLPRFLGRLSKIQATAAFFFYAILNGLTLSVVASRYTTDSLSGVFFLTAAMFGVLALFGTVTRKDLGPVGTFMGLGMIGMILVAVLNLFLGSEALNFGLGVAGVLIFSGLAAYDAQKLKQIAMLSVLEENSGITEKTPILCALILYLDFINLFLSLLRLFGKRR